MRHIWATVEWSGSLWNWSACCEWEAVRVHESVRMNCECDVSQICVGFLAPQFCVSRQVTTARPNTVRCEEETYVICWSVSACVCVPSCKNHTIHDVFNNKIWYEFLRKFRIYNMYFRFKFFLCPFTCPFSFTIKICYYSVSIKCKIRNTIDTFLWAFSLLKRHSCVKDFPLDHHQCISLLVVYSVQTIL